MVSYACYLIDVANASAMNRILNDYNGDAGDNLGQPLSPTGAAPATHLFGGDYVDEAWLAVFQNLGMAPYVPAGGYPLPDGTTEADALAAQAALQLFVQTGPDDGSLPHLARAAMLAATGLRAVQLD